MSDTTAEQVVEQSDEAQEPVVEQAESGEESALGDAGKKALDAERTARKEAEKRLNEALAQVEQFQDAQRTDEEKRQLELERLRGQVEEERKQREAVERDLLVRSVAAEYDLPDELAVRLSGSDREALVEDAKVLQKLMKPAGPRRPAPVPEAGSASAPKQSNADRFAELVGNALSGK